MGYRWHFWSDWWGYAGGGLVDVDRIPKRTYGAFRDASRPLLMIGVIDRSVVEPGTTSVRIVAVNDRSEPARGRVDWTVHRAKSAVFAPDPEGSRIGLPMPPDEDSMVAIERSRGAVVADGTLALTIAAGASAELGTVRIPFLPGEARTLLLRWNDPTTGAEENSVHLCCLAGGIVLAPGMSELP
jgi:hypothetical protein